MADLLRNILVAGIYMSSYVHCMKMRLRDKISEFVAFIDDPPMDDRDAKLLRLADQILYVFGKTQDRSDDKKYPDTPKRNYESKRKDVATKLRDYGYYNLPDTVCRDIASSKMRVGDAIDDLVDLYYVFSNFLWRCENTSEDDAIWYFKNPERFHWEEHLRGLQYYLFHKIDEEIYTEQLLSGDSLKEASKV